MWLLRLDYRGCPLDNGSELTVGHKNPQLIGKPSIKTSEKSFLFTYTLRSIHFFHSRSFARLRHLICYSLNVINIEFIN